MQNRFWKASLLIAACGAIVLGLTACDPEDLVAAPYDATRAETKAFPVAGVPVLSVESSNGSVSVRGVAGQTDVRVTATIRSRGKTQRVADERAAAVTLRLEQQGGRILLAYRGSEQTDDVRRYAGVAFDVTTPTMLEVGVTTSNGPVSAASLQGRIGLTTSNGEVTVADVVGQVTADTSNGRIVVDRCQGVLDLATSNGAVAMTDVGAAFDVVTSNGAIRFRGTPIGDANSLVTSNGSIDVAVPAAAAIEFTARTSGGSISSSLPLVGDTQGKEWLATLNPPASAKMTLHTSNGAVSIAAGP
jgi:hypothetical protein